MSRRSATKQKARQEEELDLLSESAEGTLVVAPARRKPMAMSIDSGNHSGAVFFVDEGISTLGASEDCDYLLTDEGIADKHLTFSITKQRYGLKTQATAHEKGAALNGVPMKIGRPYTLQSHDNITLRKRVVMGVLLDHTSASQAVYERTIMPMVHSVWAIGRPVAMALHPRNVISDKRNIALALCGLMSCGLGGGLWYLMNSGSPYSTGTEIVEQLPPVEMTNTVPVLNQAANFMNNQLSAQRLTEVTSLNIEGNTLVITGRLSKEETARLNEARIAYDENFGTTVELIVNAELNAPALERISFRAVFIGKQSFVVSWTGDRFGVGAMLPNGYRIVSISDEAGIELINNGRTVMVKP